MVGITLVKVRGGDEVQMIRVRGRVSTSFTNGVPGELDASTRTEVIATAIWSRIVTVVGGRHRDKKEVAAPLLVSPGAHLYSDTIRERISIPEY